MKQEKVFQGNGVSPGVVLGSALKLDSHNRVILNILIDPDRVEEEVLRFQRTLQVSKAQLDDLKSQWEQKIGHEYSHILDAHLLMLEDENLLSEIVANIRKNRVNAEWAVRQAVDRIRQAYQALEDQFFRERGSEIENVLERLLLNLAGERPLDVSALPEDLIIVAQEFNPTTFAVIDLQKVKGMALGSGGLTSHTAIIARSLRVPAVMEVRSLLPAVTTGDLILLDGDNGQVFLNPSADRLDNVRHRLEEFQARLEALQPVAGARAQTRDGRPIFLQANTELPHEVRTLKRCGAEGIGLFRTEFLFLAHPHGFPTMEDQLEIYRIMAVEVHPYRVAVRTLDVFADRVLSGEEVAGESNPAMGLRGIRLSLRKRELFAGQIEAILRASHYGSLEIVLPMISTVEEIWEARSVIQEVRERLIHSSIPVGNEIPIGAMIEVPSAVLMIDLLARELDFLCVGTNDLIQYMLGVDRNNHQVAYLYQPLHPSILQCLSRIEEVCRKQSKPVRVCGEIASNPFYAVLLLGMGFSQLSMNAFSIPTIRKVLSSLSSETAQRVASRALRCFTSKEVGDYLIEAVSQAVKIDLSAYIMEIQSSGKMISGVSEPSTTAFKRHSS